MPANLLKCVSNVVTIGVMLATAAPSLAGGGDLTADAVDPPEAAAACMAPDAAVTASAGNGQVWSDCWHKGLNYDPAGDDTWDWGGSPVDPKVVWQDVRLMRAAGARWVRLSVPAPTLLRAPPGETWQEAADVARYNFNTVLNVVKANKLAPEILVLAWCYTPTSEQPGCYNPSENRREPNDERAAYEAWLTKLVLTSGARVFEFGTEVNLNYMEETNYTWNPDLSPSGWNDMPDCQLDDPDTPAFACNNVPKYRLPGVNPYGLCHGELLPGGHRAPHGPSQQYRAAVASYANFLKESYVTVKKANPRAMVVSASLSSWHAACFIDAFDFKTTDAVGYHAYPICGGPMNAADTVDYLTRKVGRLRTPYHSLPIWVTEFGFTIHGQGAAKTAANEQQKAEFLREEWALLRCKVTGPDFWYQLRDTLRYDAAEDEPVESEPGSGIVRWVDRGLAKSPGAPEKLPAFYAFRDMKKMPCRELRAATAGDSPDDPFASGLPPLRPSRRRMP